MASPVKQLSTVILLGLILESLNPRASQGATPATHQSLSSIRAAVTTFVRQQHPHADGLRARPGRLDTRLRLKTCERPLEAFWAPGSSNLGHTTVGVRCTGRMPWKLYVPTQVSVLAPVAVAARPLARGQRIGAGDLRLEKRELGKLGADVLKDPRQALDYVVTRSVAAGSVLTLRLLAAPRLVQRGHRVQLEAEAQGLSIRMAGVALDDGALGDTVRVRNPSSKRVVQAVVTALGRVRLGGSQ